MSLSRPKLWSYALLVLMGIVIVFQRLHTYDEPLERDLTIYSVIAQGLREGRVLYADLWDIKPPGVYYFYALAQMISRGDMTEAVFLLGAGASLATLLGLFVALWKLTRNHTAACWGAAFWMCINNEMLIQANQPNTEVFLNALLVWALVPLIGLDDKPKPRDLYLSFGLLALSSTIKQITVVWALAWLLLALWKLPRPLKKSALWAFASAFFLVWGGVSAFFAFHGAWDDFRWTMIDFARLYVSAASQGDGMPLQEKIVSPLLHWLWPLAALCLVWPLVVLWTRQNKKQHQTTSWNVWLLITYAVSTVGGIWLPHQFQTHYYQLWLPSLCLVSGMGVASLFHFFSTLTGQKKALLHLAPVAVFALVASKMITDLMLPSFLWSQEKYGPAFQYIKLDAQWLGDTAPPNTLLYQYGFDPGFNFYSGLKPASGVVVVGHVALKVPDRLEKRVLRDLEHNNPDVCIVTDYFPKNGITKYIREHYVVIQKDSSPYIISVRKGSPLLAAITGGNKMGFKVWLQRHSVR